MRFRDGVAIFPSRFLGSWWNFYIFSTMIAIPSLWTTLNSNSYSNSDKIIPRNINARHLAVRLLATYFHKTIYFLFKTVNTSWFYKFLEWLLLKKEFIKIEAGYGFICQKMTLEMSQKLRFVTSNFNTNFKILFIKIFYKFNR